MKKIVVFLKYWTLIFFDGNILGEESKLYLLYGYDCHIVIECLGYNILYI